MRVRGRSGGRGSNKGGTVEKIGMSSCIFFWGRGLFLDPIILHFLCVLEGCYLIKTLDFFNFHLCHFKSVQYFVR